jgi:Fe-S cluster assembly protein SufB
MSEENKILKKVANEKYKYGFVSKLDSEKIQKGLNEDVIKLISKKREEPDWLLKYRLRAFEKLKSLSSPKWANIDFEEIDLQSISYYSAIKKKKKIQFAKRG